MGWPVAAVVLRGAAPFSCLSGEDVYIYGGRDLGRARGTAIERERGTEKIER